MSSSYKKVKGNINNIYRRKINIKNFIKKEIFSNHFYELDKAINSKIILKSPLKIYYPEDKQKNPLIKINKRAKSTLHEKESNSKLFSLNKSILNIFKKMDKSKNASMKIYHNKKIENNLFLNKFKKLQKFRESKKQSKANSAIISSPKFSYFDDLIKKYKMDNNITIGSEMFKNKDLYKSNPIVLKDKKDMEFYYLFNHDKYYKKTNPNCQKISFIENKNDMDIKNKNEKENKIIKNKKEINYNKLKEVLFFKKLILASNKRIKELKKYNEEEDENNFDYNNNSIIQEKKLDESIHIEKDKQEINELINSLKQLEIDNKKILDDSKNFKLSNIFF